MSQMVVMDLAGPRRHQALVATRAPSDETIMLRLCERISAHPHPTIFVIQTMTAEAFNMKLATLLGRNNEHIKARYYAMVLCRRYLGRVNGSKAYIARKFGRDRWSVRRAEERYGDLVRSCSAAG